MFLFSQPNRWDTAVACSHHVATKLFSVEICLPSSPHLGISAQKTRVKNLVISRMENTALDIHEYTCILT